MTHQLRENDFRTRLVAAEPNAPPTAAVLSLPATTAQDFLQQPASTPPFDAAGAFIHSEEMHGWLLECEMQDDHLG